MTTIHKKTKRKYLNRLINGNLVAISINENNICYDGFDIQLKKQFLNAYHCGDVIRYDIDTDRLNHKPNKTGHTNYCKCRSCIICSGIRTAELIQKYNYILKDFDLVFMTLTVPNCSQMELKPTLQLMFSNFSKIKDVMRKRKHSINGMRKLEITYNNKFDSYHPHFHCLIDNSNAEMFVSLWLKMFPASSPLAQDIRSADENTLIELFKYVTKFNLKDFRASYIILKSLYGIRTFQTFGHIKAIDIDYNETKFSVAQFEKTLTLFYDKLISGYREDKTKSIVDILDMEEINYIRRMKDLEPENIT